MKQTENKNQDRTASELMRLLGTREIKFRVRDQNTNKVVGYEQWDKNFGWTFYLLAEKENGDYPIRSGTVPDSIDRCLRERFTGLEDKNGKEIYEGDILKLVYEDKLEETGFGCAYNMIVFSNGSFCWKGERTGELHSLLNDNLSESEVAGNIFENPELLDECT